MNVTSALSVADVLERIPAWADVVPGDKAGLDSIESAVREMADVDASTAIDGIRVYVDRCERDAEGFNVSAMSRVFVLNRFLFAVPDDAPLDQPRFGGFLGVPVTDDRANDLWPWSPAPDGDLHLTGYFLGYAGETFLAVSEAESFRDRFGLRREPSGKRRAQ